MTRSHPDPSHPADCFGCKLHSIEYGKVPGGARDHAAAERVREKNWSRDMDAYASMREQGLQPAKIDGSGDLAAAASDSWEVEHGIVMSPELRKSHLSAYKEVESAMPQEPKRDWNPASTMAGM